MLCLSSILCPRLRLSVGLRNGDFEVICESTDKDFLQYAHQEQEFGGLDCGLSFQLQPWAAYLSVPLFSNLKSKDGCLSHSPTMMIKLLIHKVQEKCLAHKKTFDTCQLLFYKDSQDKVFLEFSTKLKTKVVTPEELVFFLLQHGRLNTVHSISLFDLKCSEILEVLINLVHLCITNIASLNQYTKYHYVYGFPDDSVGKKSGCNGRHGFNPWPGNILERAWQPTCPEKSLGQSSLAGYSPWGDKELDMTESIYECIY